MVIKARTERYIEILFKIFQPQMGPWPPEGCHLAQCIFIGIIMIRVCPIPGIACGAVSFIIQSCLLNFYPPF